jgi:hypothetical protein
MELNKSKISNVKFDGIDYEDAPDFCDAYIVSAEYDGEEMTDEQIDLLNEDIDYVYEILMNIIY